MHPDNHAIWWSADGRRIIEGNDGGVDRSAATAATRGRSSTASRSRQIYHVGFDDNKPYTICGGLQDNSSWCAPTTARNGIGLMNRDWFAIAGGDGMFAIPDPVDPSLIWTNTQDGVLGIYDSKARQSVDVSPYPARRLHLDDSLARSPYRFNWNAPLAFSPQDGHVAYFGGNVIFKTTDRGRHWTPISPDLTRNEKDHQIASGGPITLDVSGAEYYDTTLAIAPSPKDAGVIWAGTDDGLVQLTRDGGAHWSAVTPRGWPQVRPRRGDRRELVRGRDRVRAARPPRPRRRPRRTLTSPTTTARAGARSRRTCRPTRRCASRAKTRATRTCSAR